VTHTCVVLGTPLATRCDALEEDKEVDVVDVEDTCDQQVVGANPIRQPRIIKGLTIGTDLGTSPGTHS
jgi:hypothetical protein